MLSSIYQENGVFMFIDYYEKKQALFNATDFSSNHSRVNFHITEKNGKSNFVFFNDISSRLSDIHDGSINAMIRNVILLSLLQDLIEKPRIYEILFFGERSLFSDHLAKILEKFNDQNHMYCLTDNEPPKEFSNVSFMPKNLVFDQVIFPKSKFSAVILDNINLQMIPLDIATSLKVGGKLFFISDPNLISETIFYNSKVFAFDEKVFLFELCMTADIKEEFYRQTPQGQIEEIKKFIADQFEELQNVIKKLKLLSFEEQSKILDQSINNLHKSEKLINEIYVELNSVNIKPYFNELKEIFIDCRLQQNRKKRQKYYEKIEIQYQKVLQEMNLFEDFVFEYNLLKRRSS
ncbi:MAG: hypothetical protein IJ728_11845 [Selenomonadaceae bacterium]|nr:hypothetical protein [Selenomonadaceae bacterium]